MSFSDALDKELKYREAEESAWALGEYVSKPCPNCGRQRLCKCSNGKHRCEKCNWIPEDDSYCHLTL